MARLTDDDLQEEIRAHLKIAVDERIAAGQDPKTAREAALKEFGNVTLTREAAHRVRTPRWIDAIRDYANDVRYAFRSLAKNPIFSLTVVAVLTLGIGLNSVVFTMLKGMAITPLAGVGNASRLAVIFGETSTGRDVRVSYPDYQYLRDHNTAFASMFGSGFAEVTLGRGRSARQVSSELVTGNYFDVLGVRASLGRTLQPSDEVAPGRHPVVVISHSMWQTDFHGDPDIIGTPLELNNFIFTVVGVAAENFHGTIVSYDVETDIPVMMAAEIGVRGSNVAASGLNPLVDPTAGLLFPQGFLQEGISFSAAIAETDAIWSSLGADRPASDVVKHLRVIRFRNSPTGGQVVLVPVVTLLTVMGLLVLMIACANIAGLVVVRGVSRRAEVALRLALGATRSRIVRLLIIENLVLAIPGAILGVALTAQIMPMFIGYAENLAAPQRLFLNVQLDGMVVGFAVAVGCLCALVFGFVPALQSSQVDLMAVMNDASPRGSARGRLRGVLVVGQVAVSLALLVGAGLVTGSLAAAEHAQLGYDGHNVATVKVDLKANAYDEAGGRIFYRKLLDAARAEPGVEAATFATYTPLTFLETRAMSVTIDGYQPRKDEDLSLLSNVVGPDYFRTLKIPLASGREFEDRDDQGTAPVAIVNRTMADRFWGGPANAIGQRLRVGDDQWRTVVGVAADLKYARINEAPRPYIYVPFFQSYRSLMILHTRGSVPIERLIAQASADVATLDADLPIVRASTLENQTRGALFVFRLMAVMLFAFGAAGMALAAMGTYGLVSYTVTESTQEIGIRMALGATGALVVRQFLGRGLRLGAIGIVLGTAAAVGVSQLLASVLFGISAMDPLSFTRALAIVLAGVGLATVVPAWRASRTDPLKALRHR
jgi:predicted permease